MEDNFKKNENERRTQFIFEKLEWQPYFDQLERRPQEKMEDDLQKNWRGPKQKMEEDLKKMKWKTTSNKIKNGRQPQRKI